MRSLGAIPQVALGCVLAGGMVAWAEPPAARLGLQRPFREGESE